MSVEVQTKEAMSPPNKRSNVVVGNEFPDDIRELGDRIVCLGKKTKELIEYLKTKGIKNGI